MDRAKARHGRVRGQAEPVRGHGSVADRTVFRYDARVQSIGRADKGSRRGLTSQHNGGLCAS